MSTNITNDIISKINEFQIKNESFTALKKDIYNNTDGENFQELVDYDAMLDNISVGAHTNTTIDFVGIEWKLRLLTAEEWVGARLYAVKKAREEDTFDDWYVNYWLFLKILEIALSPSPFKTQNENNWTVNKLMKLHMDVIEVLFGKYEAFVNVATRRIEEMTEKELQELIDIVKKKPEVLMGLDRRQLLVMSRYLLNGYQNLEKIIKSE